MDSLLKYNIWNQNDYFDKETRDELALIKDDSKEIEERFYKDLEFGTGGLRGIIGAGTNRMNKYTVRRASQGLANYITKFGSNAMSRGVVIAYDSRFKSEEFALESALVFAANGIKSYVFEELKPTPELSFAVRHLNAYAGIVITASHNPKEYNGYKVYGDDGAQLSIDASNAVINQINSIQDLTKVEYIEKEKANSLGLLEYIGKEIDDIYTENLKKLVINQEEINKNSDMKIVFTPLHGTGNKPVRRVLSEIGFKNVQVVKEQELPDSEFSTIKYPNPEDKDAFDLAIKLAKSLSADVIIGTDPDADRIGVLVKDASGDYNVLTGNQTGCLLTEYMLSQLQSRGKMPKNPFIVKTIVTTELVREIAKQYNVEIIEVLTGFKFIGEQIKLLDEQGDKSYVFGFEESYGYLAGTFARDKDAVVASMLIAEMAAFYRSTGMTLYDGLMEIYKKYGYTLEDISTFTLKGKDGIERIKSTMNILRKERHRSFGNTKVGALRDYELKERVSFVDGSIEKLDLPQSDVLYYELKDGSWFCIRPSGTEPKIKVYYGATAENYEAVRAKIDNIKNDVLSVVEKMLFD